jgi:hypothetical protein
MIHDVSISQEWRLKPISKCLWLSSLGWLADAKEAPLSLSHGHRGDLEIKRAITDFMVVVKAFGFDESNMGKAWTMREFGVLLSKIQTNSIDGSLYIASSMFNHSCDKQHSMEPK